MRQGSVVFATRRRNRGGSDSTARIAGFPMLFVLALLISVSPTLLARAVVVAGPDGAINTAPPLPDPGFSNVGRIGATSGVYLRNGWVLTANHVGEGSIVLGGVRYYPLPGSGVRLSNAAAPHPDLFAFKLEERPPLPDLELASGPPVLGETILLAGNSRDRGAPVVWQSPGGISFEGWALESTRTIRWGTNAVEGTDLLILDTHSFASVFDDLKGPQRNDSEAQVVAGDSGGAVFRWNGATPELLGLLFARSSVEPEQMTQSLDVALFGNASIAADLHFYRDEIASLVDRPDCDDGLDEDGDGAIDFPDDPGCADALDDSERDPGLVCDNGLDDDGDLLVDYPADGGCSDLLDPDEVPEPGFGASLALGLLMIAFGDSRRLPGRCS